MRILICLLAVLVGSVTALAIDLWLPVTEGSARLGGPLHLFALVVLAITALLLVAAAAATVLHL